MPTYRQTGAARDDRPSHWCLVGSNGRRYRRKFVCLQYCWMHGRRIPCHRFDRRIHHSRHRNLPACLFNRPISRMGESSRRMPRQHVAADVSLRKTGNDVTLAANASAIVNLRACISNAQLSIHRTLLGVASATLFSRLRFALVLRRLPGNGPGGLAP